MTTRSRPAPTLQVETGLARQLRPHGEAIIVGLDEVGRGALAGPVVIGACAIRMVDAEPMTVLPPEVRDSKLLTPRRREALAPRIRQAAPTASGWASAAEIDELGILPALARAARRALTALELPVHAILLDGSVDVLARDGLGAQASVTVRVGADRDCASVAAASVVAKVERDAHMQRLDADAPQYGWAGNKGYGSAAHRQALREYGAHPEHRRSWNLGLDAPTLPLA
ncbi:ribonuclease HII [Brachybacterium sp. EF45031]|uniref:ribonuclease HII n=1 Tax=Brachybacterium sillae TaxID=2810536 RepID=UPI00217D34F2|nr:ribonuclease HII [Brachybacterium sillae]MCS6712324.1 ribonuclease HII [Brachybacterium sillae]